MEEAQAAKVNEVIGNFIAQKEQRDYEENLHNSYDAFFSAEEWDKALYHAALIEEYVIPKYGTNSCEYATALYKKGVVYKMSTYVDDKIVAIWHLIESKKLYEQFGLKYSECWKCCMRELNELMVN